MNLLPSPAQRFQVIHQDASHGLDLPARESIILPQLHRSYRTVQIEYRLATSANHMNMGRSMIVRINNNPQSIKPENRRHYADSSRVPKRLGLSPPFPVRTRNCKPGIGAVDAVIAASKNPQWTTLSRDGKRVYATNMEVHTISNRGRGGGGAPTPIIAGGPPEAQPR
jgi:hypothetical protein